MSFSKSVIIAVSTLFIFPISSHAGWLEFGAGCPDGSEPAVLHNITIDEFISFDVELHGLQAETVRNNQTDYIRFTGTPGTSPMKEVGYPELPVVTCFVAIPDESDITLDYACCCMSRTGSCPVYPAPLDSLVEDSLHTPYYEEFFRKDSSAYANAEWYPEEQAVLSGEFRLRDQRVAIVDVYPVQYLASEDSLRVWSDIELYLNFEGPEPVWTDAGLGYYDRLVGDRLIGYTPSYTYTEPDVGDVFRHDDISSEPPFVPDYIIIAADGLDGSWIDDFAMYRANLNGFDVLIANVDDILDQIGGSPPYPTADLIRDYTELIWNWSSPGDRPTYLLLIGDHEDASCTTYPSWLLPAYQFAAYSGTYLSANDDWCVYFDEPRETEVSFPDMMVGRLSTREAENLQNMLDLIVAYESEDQLPGPAYRRYITRLAGRPDGGGDLWHPSPEWTNNLRQWLGYQWDNYYCGDGEDTWQSYPPNPDGSDMTSEDWVNACTEVFERGSQVLFYTDHGGVHYFECAMDDELSGDLGRPDSTFDDLDVRELTHGEGQISPFVLLKSCSQGTFNWTYDQHYNSDYSLWNCYSDDPFYDFGVDCFAEELMKNTNGGAIGVFGASWAASKWLVGYFDITLEQPFCYGITRLGDMIQAGRFQYLGNFYTGGSWRNDLGLFNLLGDPAVDIGDRVKFRDCCDLIISPADLEINRYPTLSLSGGSGEPELLVTVRNAGAITSGSFFVSLDVEYDESVWHLSSRCDGLDPGEEEVLKFIWENPPSNVSGHVHFSAEADPQENTPDSWRGNNTAESTIRVLDFYPNEDGWPVRTQGSIKFPPLLADIDSDDDLEILSVLGNTQLAVWNHDSAEPVWIISGHEFNVVPPPQQNNYDGYTIPVAADLDGGGTIEIIIDSKTELLVLDSSTGNELFSFQHEDLQDSWEFAPHTPAVGDIIPEHDATKLEIVLPVNNTLYVLGIRNNSLEVLDSFGIKPPGAIDITFSWISISDFDDQLPGLEVAVSGSGKEGLMPTTYWTRLGLYSHLNQGSFYSTRDWTGDDLNLRGIPATGSLPLSGDRIALSRKVSAYPDYSPVFLMDPEDLIAEPVECQPPTDSSDHVLCCVMADWDPFVAGADRIIANAENQAMAWYENGDPIPRWEDGIGYPAPGENRPPFPALGELDNQDQYDFADYITATREGSVMAFASGGHRLANLGFPYTLPSEIFGGFVVADIDNDGYVEVVFGTMDNYLHIWELGECNAGYSPWPQCQHDAARTGVLLEE